MNGEWFRLWCPDLTLHSFASFPPSHEISSLMSQSHANSRRRKEEPQNRKLPFRSGRSEMFIEICDLKTMRAPIGAQFVGRCFAPKRSGRGKERGVSINIERLTALKATTCTLPSPPQKNLGGSHAISGPPTHPMRRQLQTDWRSTK